MQTKLSQQWKDSPSGKKAGEIIQSCVHCGFCLATCPTYQLLGNELDSPRGRIYLIKSALEDNELSQTSIQHLDQCLTCRSCETTCPSGVKYGELVDIGREIMEPKRVWWQKLYRTTVRIALTSPRLFNLASPLFKHSSIQTTAIKPTDISSRVLLLAGCVQPALAPNINHATKNVLAKLGIEAIETKQNECCGAINQHLSAQDTALIDVKRNIDNWSAALDSGIDNIISTASGCGVMVKDYPHLFDPTDPYYPKAVAIAQKTKDIAEFLLAQQDLTSLSIVNTNLSYQAPCTLQHGQKLPGLVEQLLTKLGISIQPTADPHLCCGSAGTYSIFQPTLSKQLRNNKLKNLTRHAPDIIVTANIGCLMHLQKGTDIPVKHWIELLDY